MVGVPVIINHKDLNKDNADDERVGVVNSVWYDNKDGWYWCDGIIWDETAQNLITDQNWSVSCSYDVKTANDEGGSENNIKYDMEFLDGVFTHLALVDNPRYERANIVFNSKTEVINGNIEQPRVPAGCPEGGQFAKKDKYISGEKSPIEKFYDIHRNYAEPAPEEYKGKPTFKAVLAHLGSKNGDSAIIKTPLEDVIFNRNNLHHLIIEHPERLPDLNKMIRTLQSPNLVISGTRDNKNYNYYIKNFKENNKNTGQFEVIKIAPDGSFYCTSYSLNNSRFKQIINEGQIIFDLTYDSTAIQKNVSVDNIINDVSNNFNPNVKENEEMNIDNYIVNNKEQEMALLEEIKKLITKVENDKGEDMDDKEIKEVENEKIDKRKLIDEVGGILKGKVDDEIIRTIIGKIEKAAYDKSEAGTADNEKEEDKKEDAENCKKVKNEDAEDKEKVEEVKEEVKEDVENKCKNSVDNAKTDYFAKLNEIYNSVAKAKETQSYVSRADREKAAEDYFRR